jgi:hypothetical protein
VARLRCNYGEEAPCERWQEDQSRRISSHDSNLIYHMSDSNAHSPTRTILTLLGEYPSNSLLKRLNINERLPSQCPGNGLRQAHRLQVRSLACSLPFSASASIFFSSTPPGKGFQSYPRHPKRIPPLEPNTLHVKRASLLGESTIARRRNPVATEPAVEKVVTVDMVRLRRWDEAGGNPISSMNMQLPMRSSRY